MSVLAALPLLPLVAALWLALGPRRGLPGVLELVSLAPIAAALFIADASVGIPYFLTTDVTVFELDTGSRASLLLFGSLWLTAGLMDRRREYGRSAIALLLALSGAVTVALAKQGPALLCGMLVAGFGLCAIMASESGTAARRTVRILAALLVASYLLVFEVLLHVEAHPSAGMTAASAAMIILAVVLSAAIPPAHAWQAAALVRASAPTSLLLVGAPAGVALTAGSKLLSGGGTGLAPACLVLAMAAAAWSAWAGARQRAAIDTLARAAAATASLLLVGLTVATAPTSARWLMLSLLASLSGLAVLRVQRAGVARHTGIIAVVFFYGIAAGQLALHAANALPGVGRVPASVVAVLATILVTLAARRIAATPVLSIAPGGARFSLLFIALAASGIGVAWLSGADEPASALPALAGIALGLLLPRLLPAPRGPGISSGDRMRLATGALMVVNRGLARFCEYRLPRFRDRQTARLVSLWHGKTWSARIERLEALLACWPATALGMLLVAIAIGLLLLG